MPGALHITPEMERFHQAVSKDGLEPLWLAASEVMLQEPKSKPIAHRWKRDLLRRRLQEAAEIINFRNGGDRRVLMLINPGMRDLQPYGWGATTQTLSVCVQILLPGEEAPPHRHTQTAIRFIMEGSGVYSAVEGEKAYMSEGDYVITPKGLWHEHGHEGDAPMMWMDCLDTPFIYYMHGTFFERADFAKQGITKTASVEKYRGGMVRPITDHVPTSAPLSVYSFDRVAMALEGLSAHTEPDEIEGYAVEYFNPSNGRSANENIGAWMQKLPPGFHGKSHRHVNSAVYEVKQGSGYTLIDGIRMDWSEGDIFVVPTWAYHEHVNSSETEPACLFSVNDIPIFERLELQREEAYPHTDGFQAETSVFKDDTVCGG